MQTNREDTDCPGSLSEADKQAIKAIPASMFEPKKTTTIDEWNRFLHSHPEPWCWNCGRDETDRPSWWGAWWLVERAHIIAGNRQNRKDRRAAILLCSLCHKLQHGENIVGDFEPELREPLTMARMLGLKQLHDAAYYDPEFLEANCVGRLPEAEACKAAAIRVYIGRRG